MIAEKMIAVTKPPQDPYFKNNVILINGGNAANGAQNSTFLDTSGNNVPITITGSPAQGSINPYGSNWSAYFSYGGATFTGSCITVSRNTTIATGPFTIEAFIYPTVSSSEMVIFENATWGAGSSTKNAGYRVFLSASNKVSLAVSAGVSASDLPTVLTSSGSISANRWTHIALVRGSNNIITIYINGVADSNILYYPASLDLAYAEGPSTRIGAKRGGTSIGYYSFFNGYISNLRVTDTAVYTTNFSVPTMPLRAISGTQLLTLYTQRCNDGSSNNATITKAPNGSQGSIYNPYVAAFGPFNPSLPYSTSTSGGSIYLDGSDAFATSYGTGVSVPGSYTFETWFYLTSATSTNQRIIYGGSFEVALVDTTNFGGNLYLSAGGTYPARDNANTKFTLLNKWNHIALVRGGTQGYTLYLNGVATLGFYARYPEYNVYPQNGGGFIGYMAGYRFVNGTAVYTSNFTPPTAPPAPISGTNSLLNFTNAGICDYAMMNDFETVGSAQVSTSVKKYGTGSVSFNGTNSYLMAAANPNLDLGSGDFTIEGWVYANSFANYRALISLANNVSNGYSAIRLRVNSSGTLELYMSNNGSSWAASGTTSSGISATTWAHVAIVRFGSASDNVKVYINGVDVLTLTNTGALYASGASYIGTVFSSSAAGEYFNGYIDDFRITKGIARYTSNFTPPTAALPVY